MVSVGDFETCKRGRGAAEDSTFLSRSFNMENGGWVFSVQPKHITQIGAKASFSMKTSHEGRLGRGALSTATLQSCRLTRLSRPLSRFARHLTTLGLHRVHLASPLTLHPYWCPTSRGSCMHINHSITVGIRVQRLNCTLILCIGDYISHFILLIRGNAALIPHYCYL